MLLSEQVNYDSETLNCYLHPAGEKACYLDLHLFTSVQTCVCSMFDVRNCLYMCVNCCPYLISVLNFLTFPSQNEDSYNMTKFIFQIFGLKSECIWIS